MKRIKKKLLLRYNIIKKHPLTKASISLAMLRYIYFNISQSIYPKPRIFKWISGLKFYAQKGDAGIVGNIYYKLMDYPDSMFLIDKLSKNDLFVDVGANLGHFSLLAAGISKAKVIAIEPIEETNKKLTKNIELNNLSHKIEIIKYGVGDKNEVLHFTTNRNVMNRVSLNEDENTTKIEVKTLNEILRNVNPLFIKIDVEGYEYNALKGANEILKKTSLKYLMVEFNNSGEKYNLKDQDVFNLILKYNFVPIGYCPETKTVTPLKTYNKNKFNTLFVRKSNETLYNA